MTDRLDRLADRLEIEAALTRYHRGTDRGDAELVRSAFHDDAETLHGDVLHRGPEAIAAFGEERIQARFASCFHMLSNITIRFDGDRAEVESYYSVALTLRDDPASPQEQPRGQHGAGRYLDSFERRDGEWRIVRRKVLTEFMLPPQPQLALGESGGERSREDLSYRPVGWYDA